jgi:hypothetical protein
MALYCNLVPFVVIYDSLVPVFDGGEHGIPAVIGYGFIGAEGKIIHHFFKLTLAVAAQALTVELIPLIQILEPFALVFDDKPRMMVTELQLTTIFLFLSFLLPCRTAFLINSLICCSSKFISWISWGAFWAMRLLKRLI